MRPMHENAIIDPMAHEQSSEARLSPSSDTEDIVTTLAPRLAYFAAVARTRARHPGRARARRSRSRRCRAPWSGSNRTSASPCSPATAAPSRSPRRAARSSPPSTGRSPRSSRAAESVRADADPAAGKVAFGFLHTMGSETVPGLIRAFRADHPRVRFQPRAELRRGDDRAAARRRPRPLPHLARPRRARPRRPPPRRAAAAPGRPRRPPPRRPQAGPARGGGRRDVRHPRTRLRAAPDHRRPVRGGGVHSRASPSRARRRRPCAAWSRRGSAWRCCRRPPCRARESSS